MATCKYASEMQCVDSAAYKIDFTFFTNFLANEAELIESIQYRYKILYSQVAFMSVISDPAIVFYFLFAMSYYVAPGIGLTILWVSSFSDVFSVILKTLLQEHRPYWWLAKNIRKFPNITVAQYPLSCATLPGGPSGHCLVTAAVWWAMLTMLFKWQNACERKALTFLYTVFMVLIGISRSFLASNFPHQALMGIVLGMFLGSYFSTLRIYNSPPIRYFGSGLLVILLSQVVSYLLPLIGFSVNWTFCHANSYCYDIDWVSEKHFHTLIPFIRSASMLFGTGLSLLLTSTFQSETIQIKLDITKRKTSALLAVILITVLKCILTPTSNLESQATIYYLCIAAQFFLIPVIVILFVPRLIKLYKWEPG